MTPIAIHGAAGRMGCRLIALTSEDPDLRLAGAIDRAGCPDLGRDAGSLAGVKTLGISLTDRLDPSTGVRVVIDFSAPVATRALMETCAAKGIAMVIGTTGLTQDDQRLIEAASKKTAILQATNMSLGVNLLFALAAQVAKRLGDDYDIEIVESHHRFKKDAPSGTAMSIAQAICDATGKDIVKDLVHGRHGDDTTRKRGQIGMHALRVGDVVGDHTVTFGTLGERLELSHYASTRDIFARGALRAAKWIAHMQPGRYHMKDVLGL